VASGKVRPLVVTTKVRSPLLPNVPTMAEAGWPTAEVVVWAGVMAPAGTPRVVIRQLERAFVEASLTPETRERLVVFGADPVGAGATAFAEVLEKDLALWQRVAQATGVKVE
jgi:tripartite-type tricarboxylate transporter receptor subunit TctC